jgi:hypothetical protein
MIWFLWSGHISIRKLYRFRIFACVCRHVLASAFFTAQHYCDVLLNLVYSLFMIINEHLSYRVLFTVILAGISCVTTAQEVQESTEPSGEVDLDLVFSHERVEAAQEGDGGTPSFFGSLSDNLRLNVDIVSRVQTTSRRQEAESFIAIGLDIRKVFSDEQGDFGTAVLQPYLIRMDNAYMMPTRMIVTDQNDEFSIELHDFYFNFTRWGRGRSNIKIGHFDVPFGLNPLVDTHLTLRQYQAMHDAGFKKDWGVELNGVLPKFDYAISLTSGTGMDLTGKERGPYLIAGRFGTPSDRNTIFGLSALYGDVIDDHGAHRVDEGDPRGNIRQKENIVHRWRVGLDGTHISGPLTFRGEIAFGSDFDQDVFDSMGEVEWTESSEQFSAYLQGIYRGQDGFNGWGKDIQSRLGLRWKISSTITLSSQWIHEFEHYESVKGGLHRPEDTFSLQLRIRL